MSRLRFRDIETEHLRLRLPRLSDYEYQFAFLKNKDNFPFADYAVANHPDDVARFFQKSFRGYLRTSLFWMIALKSSDEPIGTVAAWNVDWEAMSIEFGYSLYPKHRHLGYMREAIEAVLLYLYKEIGFRTFDIWTDKENQASINLALSLGFAFQGYVVEKAKNSPGSITYATYRLKVH